jgi:hypothetical protein
LMSQNLERDHVGTTVGELGAEPLALDSGALFRLRHDRRLAPVLGLGGRSHRCLWRCPLDDRRLLAGGSRLGGRRRGLDRGWSGLRGLRRRKQLPPQQQHSQREQEGQK